MSRTLSSVTPSTHVRPCGRVDPYRAYRAAEAEAFVSAVAGGIATGGTFGATHGRYVVGGWADSVVIRAGADRSSRVASALSFVNGRDITPSEGVGFWAEEGRVWLDVARSFDWRGQAEEAARENGELAIFDRLTSEIIYVR